ncbi:LOW QUALITY PROTEIN: linoleate 13S-lipoxygenase 2-1, chloroplastic-like [Beta vulgaris subsp. vulgaris]|uniref:LOW QUALITY PROTEIN: linoleate 13S-lipoxygenase 2-1, chloroplastic-like n=1 Tax=Beta vulgaris subsp. vulgaris TaxID=3555 RepID=UPI0025499EF3|nr:LOW QUALITY PROTEIN: linoleate 13S-lipoxygenase 2-1, chloroplastic-like [Beta vulgaris subsp. vulgaris]
MSVDESTHNKVLVTATITVQKPNLLESLRTNIADKLHDAYADCWEEAVFALELVNAHEDQPSMFKSVYVPRDERFSGLKQEEFGFSTLKARLHSVVPALWTKFLDVDHDFPYMTAVNLLFNEGESNNPEMVHHGTVQDSLPHVIKQVSDETDHILRFELPQSFQRDGFSWFKDEEFARQTLAGMNPLSIKCLKKEDWPLKSKLDPNIYGPPESALKVELVENEIKGSITFDEALKQNKLFIIDYHDAFLPYVNKVSEMEDRNLYGSRTLFIYDGETLKPIAIELTRPPYFDGKIQHKQWKEVFVPRTSATRGWLWKLAKAHVLAHDSSYHQLISHWLRTHCCTEPYIIAANRWLSEMHPIYRLLHPHFRYTMEINALARQALINADGIIEKTFTTGKYSLELCLCSSIYGSDWRFDREALPEDLKSRGMAVEDSNARHGWKLTIDDYPYAKDGLDLWFILKKWVEDYVHHYYGWDKENKLLENDKELHAWWEDIKTVGHGDKKNETWWPTLETLEGLIDILTTIIWVTSGHHAAVNFGQYAYAGYFPNRPTITRTKMPTEGRVPPAKADEHKGKDKDKDKDTDKEKEKEQEQWEAFLKNPEKTLLRCFPSQRQAATVMLVLDVLSSHSSEEEYLGQYIRPSWEVVPEIKEAFMRFKDGLHKLEEKINDRNKDEDLKHRCGAGILPYELLKPSSVQGVTGMGVPNSISI